MLGLAFGGYSTSTPAKRGVPNAQRDRRKSGPFESWFLDDEESLKLWAQHYGATGAEALAEELRHLHWRANPPQTA